MLYTIGNCKDYDYYLKKNKLYKSIGGSMWKDLNDILLYWYSIDGKILVNGETEKEPCGIYEMKDGKWETDVDKEDDKYGLSNKILKITGKVK